MMTPKNKSAAVQAAVLLDNPLEGEELFLSAMYGTGSGAGANAEPRRPRAVERIAERAPQPKPQHYKIVSISLYNEDIERLDRMVAELKRRGHYKANKSQLIRHALAQLDLARVPREIDALDMAPSVVSEPPRPRPFDDETTLPEVLGARPAAR